MFGSNNPFGQSSSSPFGSQSVFGQTNNNNPFTPKPFGAASPFGSQTGGSIFGGGTSTGVFGATQSSSPLASTPTFGASSTTPTFGSSVPAFGASTTPSFGTTSSPFGGSSVFGQKPAFGGFGSTPTQTSPFGSTFQQTQPAFGSNLFGSSSTFGAPSQPAFGGTSTPGFGGTSTSAFGSTSTPAFGSTSAPAFGSTTTPAFGATGSTFGVSSAPAFGSGGAFGSSSTPVFGTSTTPAFGASTSTAFGSSTPVFGAPTSSAFGAASTPSFSFGTSPAFGQSTPAFSSSQFGTTQSAFGAQSSPFGAQATTPTFGNSAFGQSSIGSQRGGSRVAAYTPTTEVDGGTGAQSAGKLESISAMQVYKDKSHEELRWEDYQLGDKGGPNPASQPAGGVGFGAATPQSNPFGPSPSFASSSANPFPSTPSSNPFTSKAPAFGSSSTPAFGSSTTNIFGTASSSTPSLFGSSTPAFGVSSSPSIFGGSGSAFGSTSSIFGSSAAGGTTAAFGSSPNFGNTQAAGLFQSTAPSLGQTNSAFGQTNSAFGQTGSIFGQTPTPAFGQSNPNPFGAATTGFGGNLFSSNSSLVSSSNQPGFGLTPSLSTPFQSQPAQTPGVFSFPNFGQAQAASSGLAGITSGFGLGTFGQLPASNSITVVQPTSVANPFGTLPAMPQISIGRSGSAPSVQYGISSMPASDKPAPIRVSSLLTSRHLSQRRIRLPARKYHPKNDGPKVPFYSDDEGASSTPKADALYIPRENPRALVINPTEKWPSRVTIIEKSSLLKDTYTPHENGGRAENDQTRLGKANQKANGLHKEEEDVPCQKGDSYITLTGHRAGEAAIVYEHGADIEALMPKLRHADYYTEPRIQELAAKERGVAGYCQRVKDFVVGRHGYGSIKFIGETDVRRLDLETLVQFNNREVMVYMDDSKKPAVGQGLNKPAVVTLLNIKCFDKKTGKQYTEGPRIDKYREMLMKRTQDQGAEFVSYEPLKGEWKFKVKHFSRYSLPAFDESPLLGSFASHDA